MLIVTGPTGSGKTTLLLSLLNETWLYSGTIKVKGSCAYVSQNPYILDGTILQNILFGEDYDEIRLEEAIKVS